ncbi:DUF5689 domain-containing protein [Aurantibacter sp.]|uniref:DUF5689 domain-containing protein n=1 Tax=Aurantibacter sp. TaxID=2807103 RepID=UPI003262EC15
MKNKKHFIISSSLIVLLLIISGCVKSREFKPIENTCSSIVANAIYSDVKNLYVDEAVQIQEDLVIEGYVISSDAAGNFFSVLHFQDKLSNPVEGFQIEIDLRDLHLFYEVGSKISIKMKGLYVGKSKEVYKIGGAFTSFGNVSVGRLPAAIADQHIFISCEDKKVVEASVLEISDVDKQPINTLVKFKNVQIIEEEVGLPFAIDAEETERTLMDCEGNEIVMLNSGYSDFYKDKLPAENGSITGVLVRDKNEYQLVVRSTDDLDLDQDRCEGLEEEISSEQIFISELADPDNNAGARFVELYNSSTKTISLNGWKFNRYTNDNQELGSSIDLTSLEIFAESTLVFAANAEEFNMVYGFEPNLESGDNSPADSNGDDNFQLIDPFDKVIDAFGVIGEDGSNTNHEFEDGRAVRKLEIVYGNAVFDDTEWIITNDTGANGTIAMPQNAPNDFTPGVR